MVGEGRSQSLHLLLLVLRLIRTAVAVGVLPVMLSPNRVSGNGKCKQALHIFLFIYSTLVPPLIPHKKLESFPTLFLSQLLLSLDKDWSASLLRS